MKYRAINKSKKRSRKVPQLDLDKVVDLKYPSFKFLSNDDKVIYEQQLMDRSGSTTNCLIKCFVYPSKVRVFDQETELNLWRATSTTEDILTDSGDKNYIPYDEEPKRYSTAKSIGKAVNYLSAKQANF